MKAALLRNPRPDDRWWRLAYTVVQIVPSAVLVVGQLTRAIWEAWWRTGPWEEDVRQP